MIFVDDLLNHLSRYVLPNVDPPITHLQICANLEIGEGEKNCTQELQFQSNGLTKFDD